MNAHCFDIPPGGLWSALLRRHAAALAAGALRPIDTEESLIKQEGVQFVVRVATSLQRKATDSSLRQLETQAAHNRSQDPFLPPDPALTVGALSETHLAVLNKFNVVDNHLLLVTRGFESQEQLLTLADFEALWRCLGEYDGLGFYNGGTVAGASQGHKHLQVVPLTQRPLPIEPSMQTAPRGQPGPVPSLSFRHCALRLGPGQAEPRRAARVTLELYQTMLERIGAPPMEKGGIPFQSVPYNLLLTRRWMLLVPRRADSAYGISINALGFAGSLFVRDRDQLEQVRRIGPMQLLREVTYAAP